MGLLRGDHQRRQGGGLTGRDMMRNGARRAGLFALAAVLSVAASCSSDDSPTAPSGGGGGSTGGPVAATITITASGLSPTSVTVAPGSRVTFVNSDNRPHEPASDPHPTHGSCPPIDQTGFIAAGQSRTTGNLNTTGTCSFHDHLNDGDARLRGTIRVQ
jgi:plastocyanin